jgi:hypothetical protein
MKKLVLTLLVVALAIPAFAADISLVDNGDGTGTIQLTSAVGEDVRGLAIVVSSENDITAITGINAELNVNMDAAFEAAEYAIGDGLDSASDPAGPGTVTLPLASISICLGKLDESGGQAALPSGTIDVATITTACGEVTITDDELRGGIVGDAVVAGTTAGGTIACEDGCFGNVTGASDGTEFNWVTFQNEYTGVFDVPNDVVNLIDLTALVNVLVNEGDVNNSYTIDPIPAGRETFDLTGASDGTEFNWVTFQNEYTGVFDPPNTIINLIDLTALVNLLVNEGDVNNSYTINCE